MRQDFHANPFRDAVVDAEIVIFNVVTFISHVYCFSEVTNLQASFIQPALSYPLF